MTVLGEQAPEEVGLGPVHVLRARCGELRPVLRRADGRLPVFAEREWAERCAEDLSELQGEPDAIEVVECWSAWPTRYLAARAGLPADLSAEQIEQLTMQTYFAEATAVSRPDMVEVCRELVAELGPALSAWQRRRQAEHADTWASTD